MWLNEWTHLPRWFTLSCSLLVLGHSGWLLMNGIVWPYEIGIGGLMLLISIFGPIGPPPRKRNIVDLPRPEPISTEEAARRRAARGLPPLEPTSAGRSRKGSSVWLYVVGALGALAFVLYAFRSSFG